MASDCIDSATGILMQLIGVCETSSDELDKDFISIISSSSCSSSTSTSKEALRLWTQSQTMLHLCYYRCYSKPTHLIYVGKESLVTTFL